MTGLYVALYLVVRSVDPSTASGMLRMYVLTMAAGRETAMLDALVRGMHPGLVYGLSVLDDFGSFLLALPFAWLVVRLLKRSGRVRWALAKFEKQALLRRRWVHRWGLGGLALVYFLPGFGAGVPVTVLLGILSGIPFRRLVPFFAVATLVVDGLWALLLTNALDVLPDSPVVEAIPLVVVATVVLAAMAGAWRGRAERHVALLDWRLAATPEEMQDLAAWGIHPEADVVRVDVDALGQRLPPHDANKGELLAVAELLMLGVTGEEALMALQGGLHGIDDVAGTDPDGLMRAMAGQPSSAQAAVWISKGRLLVDRQHDAWSGTPE